MLYFVSAVVWHIYKAWERMAICLSKGCGFSTRKLHASFTSPCTPGDNILLTYSNPTQTRWAVANANQVILPAPARRTPDVSFWASARTLTSAGMYAACMVILPADANSTCPLGLSTTPYQTALPSPDAGRMKVGPCKLHQGNLLNPQEFERVRDSAYEPTYTPSILFPALPFRGLQLRQELVTHLHQFSLLHVCLRQCSGVLRMHG